MTKDSYSLFKRFPEVYQAKEFAMFLKENGIDCIIEDNSPVVDITFSGNTLQNETQVLVKQTDFEKANLLLERLAESQIEGVSNDHYLFHFSDQELYEILMKPDEWSATDFKLAQKILRDKGQPVNEEMINSLKKERLAELSKPEKGQGTWIIIGYVFAFFGGLLGLMIGWYLWKIKKTLPNGQKVYAYSEHDRKHGKYIFIIGLILFPIFFYMKLQR